MSRQRSGARLVCEHNDTVPMAVLIPAHQSHTGRERVAIKPIDRCIAPIVEALNRGGILTVASCCGHGQGPGSIVLADGRELYIAPDQEVSRELDAVLPCLMRRRRELWPDVGFWTRLGWVLARLRLRRKAGRPTVV